MKLFAFWLSISVTCFALLSAGYHYYLSANPHRVVVVLDTSEPMRSNWQQINKVLARLGSRRYTEFSLASEKDMIHGWSRFINLGITEPEDQRDFARLRDASNHLTHIRASKFYFVTNAPASELSDFSRDWQIVRPVPDA